MGFDDAWISGGCGDGGGSFAFRKSHDRPSSVQGLGTLVRWMERG